MGRGNREDVHYTDDMWMSTGTHLSLGSCVYPGVSHSDGGPSVSLGLEDSVTLADSDPVRVPLFTYPEIFSDPTSLVSSRTYLTSPGTFEVRSP